MSKTPGTPPGTPLSREQVVALKHRRGRKPVDLLVDHPRPQGRQAIWSAIRKLRSFRLAELEHETHIGEATLRSYLQGLVAAGYLSAALETAAQQRYAPLRYTLVRDVGVEAPRVTKAGKPVTQGLSRELLWRAMRILQEFGADDLAESASIAACRVDPEDTRDYIKHLKAAGYLRVVVEHTPQRPARYRLIPVRNTGPQAPQVQRVQQVFDPNLGRVMSPEAAS